MRRYKKNSLEPKNALTKQYAELLGTENVKIEFTDDAIEISFNLPTLIQKLKILELEDCIPL